MSPAASLIGCHIRAHLSLFYIVYCVQLSIAQGWPTSGADIQSKMREEELCLLLQTRGKARRSSYAFCLLSTFVGDGPPAVALSAVSKPSRASAEPVKALQSQIIWVVLRSICVLKQSRCRLPKHSSTHFRQCVIANDKAQGCNLLENHPLALRIKSMSIDNERQGQDFPGKLPKSAKIVVYLRVVMWECEMASCKRKYEVFRGIEHLRWQYSASLSRWIKAHI